MNRPPPQALAAVDCGTNSTRLLVVDAAGRTLVRLMRITRLGAGVDDRRRLSTTAVDRTLRVLREYRAVMDKHRVAKVRMAATSAVRDASNGQVFLDAASRAIGAPAELLSGEEEGRLAYVGAMAHLPASSGDDLVVDVGGGSTELILQVDGGIRVHSLKLGCVRLTERHFAHDPPWPEEIAAAGETIDEELEFAVRAMPVLDRLRPDSRLVGLAGTVSTLAVLEQNLTEYEWDRVNHSILDREAVERWFGVLVAETSQARSARPGMATGREDVIVGGVMVLRAVMRRFALTRCLVSEADILDGLVTSLGP